MVKNLLSEKMKLAITVKQLISKGVPTRTIYIILEEQRNQ